MSSNLILFLLCSVVVVSYLLMVVSRWLRVPSVLLLLGAGVVLRQMADAEGWMVVPPRTVVEVIGTIGLIAIVLEAALDLEVNSTRWLLIQRAFWSATVILGVSTLGVALVLHTWTAGASWMSCVIYGLVLSTASSAIVLPTARTLQEGKRDFLIYEAAFSDVLGITLFNFLTDEAQLSAQAIGWLVVSIPLALVLSIAVCFLLMLLLIKSRIKTQFFILLAVLTMVYAGGKELAIPSLIVVFAFGLVVNNWEVLPWAALKRYFSDQQVEETSVLLRAITADTSFLIRTFFFMLFGLSIDTSMLLHPTVLWLGASIVGTMFALRLLYLGLLYGRNRLFPEVFYLPRGLITVLLFYKIPEWQRVPAFSDDVLFFVVLATGLILMLGSVLYREHLRYE
jgi:NhaP-type Na+/H+ or K+/H+ antiporter